jgi:hypothetical protein
MSAPVFIEPFVTKDVGDCAVVCLMQWIGCSYQEVLANAPAGAHKEGLQCKDMIAIAAKLGTTLRLRRKFDLYKDEGILSVNPWPKKHPGSRWVRPNHAVLLLGGRVLDPFNGRLWLDVEVYLREEKYKLGTLLTEEG